MKKAIAVVAAAFTALAIGFAAAPRASAAPAMTGTGGVVLDAAPAQAEEARWHGGRRWGHRGFHGRRFHYRHGFYRPYRPFRPVYYGGYGYGARCFWRPARTVWTPYGWRWRPAARICRW